MSYLMHLTRSEPSYCIKQALIQPCRGKSRRDVQPEIYFCIFILHHPLDSCFLTHLPPLVHRDAAKKLHLVRRGQSGQAPQRYSLVSCPQCLSTSWSNVFMVIKSVLEQKDHSILEVEKWQIQAQLLNTAWKSFMAEAQPTGQRTWENCDGELEPWGRHLNTSPSSIKSCPLAILSTIHNYCSSGQQLIHDRRCRNHLIGDGENKSKWWGPGVSERGEKNPFLVLTAISLCL